CRAVSDKSDGYFSVLVTGQVMYHRVHPMNIAWRLLTVSQHGGSVPEMSDITYEESHLKVLRLLESDPGLSQRDLSQALGISLGKTNYCMRALLDKGLVKMQNVRNRENKLG